MTNDLEAIRNWLRTSYSVLAPSDWLSACVEWIQQENGDQPMSTAQLQPMVFEQWLMSDLKELGAFCLPSDIQSHPSTQICGPLALQVESMLDAGLPLYGQLQKVKGTTNSNSDVSADKPLQPAWEPKPSRMMILKMTDGQTEIQGMEYCPIPALSGDLQPGFKIVVHGQVKCRRGMLMLTADNVQVLGGEVDSLMESNTQTAVLECAMEMNQRDNGKHAKKSFSGRFIQKQDFKQDYSSQKKCKVEMNSTLHQPGSFRSGLDQSCGRKPSYLTGPVKKEPLTQHTSVEDEWEEDLDYGGLLNSLDEPMDTEAGSLPQDSVQLPDHRVTSHRLDQPLGSSSAHSPFAAPTTSWQSSLHYAKSSVKAETSRQRSDSRLESNWDSDDVLQSCGAVQSTFTENKIAAVSRQKSCDSAVQDVDNMWGDDDDFDMVQAEEDMSSPVIPVQMPLGDGQRSISRELTDSTSSKPGDVSGSQKVQSSWSSNTLKRKPVTNSLKPKVGTNVSSSNANNSNKKSALSRTSLPSKQENSSRETEPPPSKQRKLTSMFSKTKVENLSTKGMVNSQSSQSCVIDLTDCESPSTLSSADFITVSQPAGSLQKEEKAGSTDAISSPAENGDCRGVCVVEKSCEKYVTLSINSSKKNISPLVGLPPFSFQGNTLSPAPDTQTLKNVQTLLQSNPHGENVVMIKGYITTLTDRLRSCQGDEWTLSCRITDGTATVEVAIADSLLAHLIGFTSKESIKLRQQAKKDPSVKDIVTQGLQKCQKALIEFSGLMEIQTQSGAKPLLVRMVKLETMKR